MSMEQYEINRRETAARAAIRRLFGTKGDEYGVTLFVSHHLEELDADYWLQLCGTAKPQPKQILDMLELKAHWSLDDFEHTDDSKRGFTVFDFTLPGDVTNYVVSVRFDETGVVERVSVES